MHASRVVARTGSGYRRTVGDEFFTGLGSTLKSNGTCDPYWHRKWTTVAQFSAFDEHRAFRRLRSPRRPDADRKELGQPPTAKENASTDGLLGVGNWQLGIDSAGGCACQRAAIRRRMAGRHDHINDQRLVVWRHDRDQVRPGGELEVMAVAMSQRIMGPPVALMIHESVTISLREGSHRYVAVASYTFFSDRSTESIAASSCRTVQLCRSHFVAPL